MSVHYGEICEHGMIHGQCRCPSPTKTVRRIVCPPETTAAHALAAARVAAASRVCRCDPDHGHARNCPSWGT